ncbi:flagellar basal body L-ring protein FlgH [bacterium]|nr:flagellar basal body L-ring protein FlgH [bacterium]
MIHKILGLLVVLISFSLNLNADSLWQTSSFDSFYTSPAKSISVGDIVVINIIESSSAQHQASTRTRKESSVGTELLSAWDQVASALGNENIRKEHELEIAGKDDYRGLGQTSRTSKVKAKVSAVVTEILESGNLFVVGEHKLKVNNEVETIRVSGIVRPNDIRIDNSVLSHQLAKAQVSVNGAGVVGSKQAPGVLTKVFNWLF